MRLLLIAVVLAAAIWSGYWWFGSQAVETALRSWLDRRADVGWVANYTSVRTRGFPNRFDTTINDLELADPVEGVAWSAPLFQILRLSYRPNHVIAVWPGEQTFTTSEGHLTIDTSQARASLVVKPGMDLELDRATAVLKDVRLDSSNGWAAEAVEGRLAVHAAEEVRNAVNVGIEIREVRLMGQGPVRLASVGVAPELPASMKLDAELTFDAAWNRYAFGSRQPNLTAVRLKQLNANWGELELAAVGDLIVDIAGLASGSVDVKVRNWREMLRVVAAEGWVPDNQLGVLETGLGLLATFAGSPEMLEVPLTIRHGKVNVGPVPLGALGPLRIR